MNPGLLSTVGIGLVTIGLGIGVGLIGSSAINGITRQPEQAGRIITYMFINIAIIEAVALLGAVVCFLAWTKG